MKTINRIIIGVILSAAIIIGVFYCATIFEDGISPVPGFLIIAFIWMILFCDNCDRSGGGHGGDDMGE